MLPWPPHEPNPFPGIQPAPHVLHFCPCPSVSIRGFKKHKNNKTNPIQKTLISLLTLNKTPFLKISKIENERNLTHFRTPSTLNPKPSNLIPAPLRVTIRTPAGKSFQFLHQHLGIPSALFIFFAARGRQ